MGSYSYIGAKVDVELKELIETVAKERGMNVSDFLRYSVRKELADLGYLTNNTRKALGISQSKSKAEK